MNEHSYLLPQFPLGTCLVPGMVIQLHIFEQRYKDMIAEVVETSRKFGIVLIERGSEVGGEDQRFDVGCTAELISLRPVSGGGALIAVAGQSRYRVVEWQKDAPYPIAKIVDWLDTDHKPSNQDITAVRSRFNVLLDVLRSAGLVNEPNTDDDSSNNDTWTVSEMAALIPVGPLDRYKLLTAPSPKQRLELVDQMIDDCLELSGL